MRLARRASRIGAVALAAALYGAAAQAADLRVGYIDSSRIFVEFKEAQEAQQRFDRLVTGWRDEALEKEKAVQQMRDEVRDQSPILSAMRRQEKEAALQRAISEYDAFIQDVWGLPAGPRPKTNARPAKSCSVSAWRSRKSRARRASNWCWTPPAATWSTPTRTST